MFTSACRYATSIIVEVTYGKFISGPNDAYVTIISKAMEGIKATAVPGRYWIECFPFLRHIPSWIPGATAQQLVKEYLPYSIKMRENLYAEVQDALVSPVLFLCKHSRTSIISEEGSCEAFRYRLDDRGHSNKLQWDARRNHTRGHCEAHRGLGLHWCVKHLVLGRCAEDVVGGMETVSELSL